MTQRITRVIRLLETLRAYGGVSITFLCERLGCSDRTVYRDLRLLKESGVPVSRDPTVDGYRITDNRSLQQQELTERELASLLLAAATSPLSRIAPIHKLIDRSLEKSLRVRLPHRSQHLSHLARLLGLEGPIREPLPPLSTDQLEIVDDLVEAAMSKSKLDVLWRPGQQPRHIRRELQAEVLHVGVEDGTWVVALRNRYGIRVELELAEIQVVTPADTAASPQKTPKVQASTGSVNAPALRTEPPLRTDRTQAGLSECGESTQTAPAVN